MILAPFDRLIDRCKANSRVSDYLETFIVFTLSVSMAVIFFDAPRWTRAFGEVGLGVFLVWVLFYKREAARPLPTFLIIAAIMYIFSYVVNVFLSSDPTWEHTNIRKYVYVFIAGLLFAFPIKDKHRMFMIVVFLVSAAVAGAAGILQYFKWGIDSRALGFSGNPLHYAGLLAFVCSTAVIILFIRKRNLFTSKRGVLFLSIVAILTFIGILFSQSRGVWVAFFAAGATTMLLYDRRQALVFLLYTVVVLSITFYLNIYLKEKATSIATSLYTENEKGSTGARVELWKGALLIFKESPLFGVGTGNFESSITRLVHEKKLKKTPTLVHAHNIFLQALATRGAVGFITTLGLFIALIQWGLEETRKHGGVGGYIIILSTAFTIISGLTENSIEFTKFLAAFCFTAGLFGPLGAMKNSEKVVVGNDE
jgi:O-antigen ligase